LNTHLTHAHMSTLQQASAAGDEAAVKVLLQDGLDINDVSSGAAPLAHACKNGHAALVSVLLQQTSLDPNIGVPKSLSSPLLVASSLGHAGIVHVLIADRRVDVNKARRDGVTPLIISVQQGYLDCISLLCMCPRLKVNCRTLFPERLTALHVAIRSNNLEAVRKVLLHPAMDLAENSYMRETPLQVAAALGESHSAIADMLRSYSDGEDIGVADSSEVLTRIALQQKGYSCTMPGLSLAHSQTQAAEQRLRNVFAASCDHLVADLVVQDCSISSQDPSSMMVQLTLRDNVDLTGPAVAGSIYSVLTQTGWLLIAAWFDDCAEQEVKISIRSASVAHLQDALTPTLIVKSEAMICGLRNREPTTNAKTTVDSDAAACDSIQVRCKVSNADGLEIAALDGCFDAHPCQ
jgi:ankyrin repeat protein